MLLLMSGILFVMHVYQGDTQRQIYIITPILQMGHILQPVLLWGPGA